MSFFSVALNILSRNRQINISGIPPEELGALIRQHEDHTGTQKKLIARLQADLDLNERQMREALRILGENDVLNEHLGAKLVAIAGHFENLRPGALPDAGDSPAIIALKLDVQKAIDAGKLARADALLEDIAIEQRHNVERSAINLAGTLARRAEIALTRLRYREAAEHFASAAAVIPSGINHEDRRLGYLTQEASTLYLQGHEFGDNAALLSAIECFQRLITPALRARVPLDWGMTQDSLGAALQTLGERERGTSRLEEAVIAYRAALEERTRGRVPLDWASSQNNLGMGLATLGTALLTLGERESGTLRLEEAVGAFREALEERTQKQDPLGWAMTQNNLSVALSTLDRLEGGTSRLEEAVAASRAAQEEMTRARVPLYWAMTQNNLGIALHLLGERENGTLRLEEAIIAYRAALEEWTRERVPLDWALTQYNLGIALWMLGERESGTSRIEEAVIAYRAALEERIRERVPLDWAATQYNLGLALKVIGERESGTSRLQEAVCAFRAALEEWTIEVNSYWHQVAQGDLADCLTSLEERSKR
ncbi:MULTISPECIES: tetratricopeptide repeat protein [unclassified Bradyrhizobium]|uniref:tetratricopeptide repeat protein n=1 Tax=unclassified Bradyrhizobium TaxID=2631580 RepID=UPI0028E1AE59|nr:MULTISPECIES: tetratricopeptide repeat protein [unclassified Bradyrhizobium]